MMCRDVIMALVGGLIGFVSSLGIMIAQHIFDKKGRISIYYKFISQKDNRKKPWGIYENKLDTIDLIIPAVFEFQNTTNTTRVLRDVHVSIYKHNQFVAKLRQIERSGDKTTTKESKYGTENGSYSFVLHPRSIQKQEVCFVYEISENEASKKDFDTIRISYYNEKDKKISYIAKENITGWKIGNQSPDIEWIKLSRKAK